MKSRLLFRLSFLTLLLSLGQLTFAQQRSIKGTVMNGGSKEPIPGASVSIKGTTTGTTTNADGAFTLSVPNDAASLLVSFVGFDSQTVSIRGGISTINISMSEGTTLNEVVVTALGIEGRKSQLSYATQRLDNKELNQSRNGDLAQQLAGRVPGLNIGTNSSSGVSSSRIVLRGETSLNINRNQPLIIVDGVVVSNNLDGVGGSAIDGLDLPTDYGNGLTDINPDDILDVSVLKGPKAAALYGTRAANGALVIRTKTGRNKEGIGVTFTTGASQEKVSNFWQEQTKYGGGFDNAFRSDWGGNFGAPYSGQLVAQNTVSVPNAAPALYEFRADRLGFFGTGTSFNNNLAVSMNSDKVAARISFGTLDKKGVVPNTNYNKYNVGLNLNAQVTDRLSLDLSANYIKSGSSNIPVLGFGVQSVMYNLTWSMSNYGYDDYSNYWLEGREGVAQNYYLSWATNPYLIVNENLNGFNRNRLFGNVKGTYKINDNLSFQVRTGTDNYNDKRKSRRVSGQNGFALGMYREQEILFQERNTDALLTYNTRFGPKVGFKIDAGANRMDQKFSNGIQQTNNLGIRGVYNLGNAADRPVLRQTEAAKRINSVYGSARFDYDNKVYLDVTGRNDWSSTLPLNNNSFFYPSVGLSAIVSDMVKLPKFVSFAQIRSSLAATGNDTDPLLTERVFNFGTLPSSVTNQALLPNTNLRPERTSAFEIGTEIKVLKNRMGVEFNYYNNLTTDQILQAPISQSSGASSTLINAGKVRNKGVELLLKGQPIVKGDFGWDVMVNYARNRGTIEELAPGVNTFVIGQGPSGGTVEARVGGRMGDIYGQDFARSPEGQIIYDKSGTTVIPRVNSGISRIGNYNPDWTMGVVNGFTYKNFNLRAFVDYRSGGSVYSYTSAIMYRAGVIEASVPNREQTFVPVGVIQNADKTFSPNTIASTGQNYYRNYFLANNIGANTYDATFMKLREVSLGIDLKKYFPSAKVASANLSIFGRNLYTWTKDKFINQINPEAFAFNGGTMVPGFEVGQLPNTRTYGFNLTVGF